MSKQIRFDLVLSDKEIESLEGLGKLCHRSRKNLCESLVKLAIKSHKNGSTLINMHDLGVVENKNVGKKNT